MGVVHAHVDALINMGDIGDLTARYGHPGSNSDVHFVGLVTDDGPLAPPDGTTVTYTELVIFSVAEPSTQRLDNGLRGSISNRVFRRFRSSF